MFFSFIFAALMMIYLFFQPLKIKQQEFIEVPLFELQEFTIHELDTFGLKTILIGSNAKRFSDRYTVKNINYTDNAKEYIANMKADSGVYKEDKINLFGDVVYAREDGLTFQSEKAHYDKKTTILSTNKEYIIYKDKNSAKGTSLEYNNLSNKIHSKNIKAIYHIQESKI